MTLFEGVQQQILNAFTYIADEYSRSDLEELLYPHRVVEVYIPIRMDDGSTRTFIGYRSQHNNIKGPYKGGIRYHQDVSKDEVMSLSARMSMKCSVVGIPLGGGKGGIVVNPKELSKEELERLTRGYVERVKNIVGPSLDVPAPDVNTTSEIMGWFADEYSKRTGKWTPGVITGKPIGIGGSQGRSTATALGAYHVLQTYMQSTNQSLQSKTVAIQGAGNAGLHFARYVVENGGKVIAMSDSRGGIQNVSGLNIEELAKLKANKKSVVDYGDGKHLDNNEILNTACDILVPAALENVITDENVDNVQTSLILEIANGPISPEADKKLCNNNITVIPDVLANAGGVTVSYFEQVQNDMNFYRSAEEVENKLQSIMQAATIDVYNESDKHDISMRDAAYTVSIRRILQAKKALGQNNA